MDRRLGCSTISFRHLGITDALGRIRGLGFDEVDLGSLPGVCDHVPTMLDAAGVTRVVDVVQRTDLRVRSINCDIGDLNDPRVNVMKSEHLSRLLELAATVGASALVLPNGRIDHQPIDDVGTDIGRVADNLALVSARAHTFGLDLWTESLHVFRLCCTIDRAAELAVRMDPAVGIVMDFSHIVASGSDPVRFVEMFGNRIRHVHIRDATSGRVELDSDHVIDAPGNINLSVGTGDVDFGAGIAALHTAGYDGHYALELETRDITDDERPSATADAAHLISTLLHRHHNQERT